MSEREQVAFGSEAPVENVHAAQARRRRAVDRLDRIRDQLAAEAHLIEREARNGWPIEAATALREAREIVADAEDLIEEQTG